MRAKLLRVEKYVLTAQCTVSERCLESRLLGIMKATSMQELEAAKLATNERGEVIDGKAMHNGPRSFNQENCRDG
jgi:hypothetical protein